MNFKRTDYNWGTLFEGDRESILARKIVSAHLLADGKERNSKGFVIRTKYQTLSDGRRIRVEMCQRKNWFSVRIPKGVEPATATEDRDEAVYLAKSMKGVVLALGKAFNVMEESSMRFRYPPSTIARMRVLMRELAVLHRDGGRIEVPEAFDAPHKVAAARLDRKFRRFIAAATARPAP